MLDFKNMAPDMLELLAARAREAYYNLTPEMSDEDYDNLIAVLRTVKPESIELKAVGAPPPALSVWEKVKHEIPMGSLDKVNTLNEFKKWAADTGASKFHITHKIDGSSMELVYEKGKLVRCVTRGDGIVGEDVTKNIQQVPTVPKTLPSSIDATIRGEIVMFKKVFDREYASTYANPRNTAAAKVREKKKGGTDCANLEYLAYWAKFDSMPGSMSELFVWLSSLGFNTPPFSSGTADDIEKIFKHVTEHRQEIEYDIDGQVVSVDNLADLESLGEVSMRPRGQTAWKFESEKAETRVLDVTWQVGPTGRITGVALVDPTPIGGVEITRVSLHNLKYFESLHLWRGCRVLLSRRNDCIPYIECNLDEPPP